MNKYILRTSLFWLLIFAVVIGVIFYRSHQRQQPASHSDGVQPIASGPAAQPSTPQMASGMDMPSQKMEAPLVPVQLSSEQMQSIGVKTGIVEYKQLIDDIRATGTVDIDERLVSYVQVRFPGYIRKVFANASYQYVKKGEPLFTIYSPDLVATQQEYLLARQNQQAMSVQHCRWSCGGSHLSFDRGGAAAAAMGHSRERNRKAERDRQGHLRSHHQLAGVGIHHGA